MPRDGAPLDLSVIVPLKDEEANVRPFHEEMRAALDALAIAWELIFVDDGSSDSTYGALAECQGNDPAVRVIRFTRNFGQTAAFAAGFAHARGRYIVTCDGDLQNDPADIGRLLALAPSHDIVCGWRRRRQDGYLTRHLPSAVANRLIGFVSGVRLHDNGCSLKLFRAEVVRPLKLRPGLHRYLPAIAAQIGERIAEIEVRHRPRRHGRSKYGLSRTFTVAADLVRLRALMRDAVDPAAPEPMLYEIASVLESPLPVQPLEPLHS